MPTIEELKLRADKVEHYVSIIEQDGFDVCHSALTSKEITEALYVEVLALSLARGHITVDNVPQKYAQRVAEKYLKEAPWRIRNDAATRGTDAHALADQLSNGEKVSISPEMLNYAETWMKFRYDWRMRFVLTEFTVFSEKWNYAGTGDFLGYSDTHPELGLICGDYKTSNDLWPDIALQLGAIGNAEFIGKCNTDPNFHTDHTGHHLLRDEATLPKIDTYVGVRLNEDGYQVVPVNVTPATFNVFRAAHIVADWKTSGEKWALDDKAFPFVPTKEQPND